MMPMTTPVSFGGIVAICVSASVPGTVKDIEEVSDVGRLALGDGVVMLNEIFFSS